MKDWLLTNWSHLQGWRTDSRIVVFESDDWGAIRMPGNAARAALKKAGIDTDQSPYNRLDCLESRDDFAALMDVLSRHHDAAGRPAKFTLNTVMGNPDFDAIKRDDFECFHHQHFFDSYLDYHGEDLKPDWRSAIQAGLIQPQFHGREHLNVPLWLNDLQQAQPETRRAFDHRFYGLRTKTSSPHQVNYLAAFWTESKQELDSARLRLKDGLDLFEQTFGFRSKTFIACNYVFPRELESTLSGAGVSLMQGQRGQIIPCPDNGSFYIYRSFIGQKAPSGLIRTIRNVIFEPYKDDSADWPRMALRQIESAFRLCKPAVVTSHRINYSSGMDEAHRDRSLRMLDDLLSAVRKRWPDVLFLSSDELADRLA